MIIDLQCGCGRKLYENAIDMAQIGYAGFQHIQDQGDNMNPACGFMYAKCVTCGMVFRYGPKGGRHPLQDVVDFARWVQGHQHVN